MDRIDDPDPPEIIVLVIGVGDVGKVPRLAIEVEVNGPEPTVVQRAA